MSDGISHHEVTKDTKTEGLPSCSSRLRGENRLPYFRTAERITALHAQLAQWRGTRWAHAGVRPNEMRCGVTGDCLFWVHVFKAIGALPREIVVPEYRSQEAMGDKMKTLCERIEATGRAEIIFAVGTRCRASDDDQPRSSAVLPMMRPGDVLLFHNGMSGTHCGLVLKIFPTHFVHLSRNGLLEEPLQQKHWLDNLAFVYRLMEDEVGARCCAALPNKMAVSP